MPHKHRSTIHLIASLRKRFCCRRSAITRPAQWLVLFAGVVLWVTWIINLFASQAFEPVRLIAQRSERALLALRLGRGAPTLNLEGWAHQSPRRSCVLDLRNAANATRDADGEATRNLYAKRARCCLRSLQKELPLGLSRRDANVLRLHGFSKHMRRFMPEETVRDTFRGGFKTCAVVSSAPSLRRSSTVNNSAAEIDSADAVFRINVAPVAGYEKWVGSKETIRLINLHRGVAIHPVVKEAYKTNGRTVFVRDEQFDRRTRFNTSRSWNVPRFGVRGALSQYLARRQEYPEGSIYLNHPVFSELSLRFLHVSLVGGNRRPLSSGAQAVFLAMMMCDKVVSFEVATDDASSNKWKYYWSETANKSMYDWWHPFKMESGVLGLLSTKRRPNSTVYEYDMAENDNAPECRAYLDSFL